MLRKSALLRCKAWKQQHSGNLVVEGRASALSGVGWTLEAIGVSLNKHVRMRSWYAMLNDGNSKFRHQVTLMVDGERGVTGQNNWWLECGVASFTFCFHRGDTLLFNGLTPDARLPVKGCWEYGLGVVSFTQLSVGGGIVSMVSLNLGLQVGSRMFTTGILAPSGVKQKKAGFVWGSPDLHTFFFRVVMIPVSIIGFLFFTAASLGSIKANSAVQGNEEASRDLQTLVAAARREYEMGNKATASHIGALLSEFVALNQNNKEDASSARELREKLEDPGSDKYRLVFGMTSADPVFLLPGETQPTSEQKEVTPADAIAARVKELQKRREESYSVEAFSNTTITTTTAYTTCFGTMK